MTEKSDFGKDITYLWQGWKKQGQIKIIQTISSLIIDEEKNNLIEEKWDSAKEDNPKWRFENIIDGIDSTIIYVSETSYKPHNALRHVEDKPIEYYPNPLSINTVQETADGYIALAKRSSSTDQAGQLALLGSGFVERFVFDEKTVSPEDPFIVMIKECMSEGRYNNIYSDGFSTEMSRVMGLVFGSNRDTTIGFYLPLFSGSMDLNLGNDEHTEILWLPAKENSINSFLNSGKFKDVPAADHTIGCIELYLKNKSFTRMK
ncbi:hypothetical protein ACFLTH_13940 [Bacteroidota bacterium]